MGAVDFFHRAAGKTAKDAFAEATRQARYEQGQGGYSGTIAEKRSFVMIAVPAGKTATDYADELIQNGDRRVDDKYGPAGCVKITDGEYLFFGWASS